jgi:hypothetical protein
MSGDAACSTATTINQVTGRRHLLATPVSSEAD